MQRAGMLVAVMCGLIAADSARAQKAPAPDSAAEHLAGARRFGWSAVEPLLENLGRSDAAKFRGIRAFADDYQKARKRLDVTRPVDEWPAIEMDRLVTHNPNFWSCACEIRPGDPGWLYVHGGLLLAAGEATRAQQILALGLQSRGVPVRVRESIVAMLKAAEQVIRDGNEAYAPGVGLFDKGDLLGAIDVYRNALRVWPQNSCAQYELGLALRDRILQEKGDKAKKAADDLPAMPEVDECFARSRRFDPLRIEAYQGRGDDVVPRLLAVTEANKAWAKIAAATKPGELVSDEVLAVFSRACQLAGIHELALVARQALVSREQRLSDADLTLIATGLRALAPGEASEAAIKRLDNPKIEMRFLVQPESSDPRP
jgi:hypothetical protein